MKLIELTNQKDKYLLNSDFIVLIMSVDYQDLTKSKIITSNSYYFADETPEKIKQLIEGKK